MTIRQGHPSDETYVCNEIGWITEHHPQRKTKRVEWLDGRVEHVAFENMPDEVVDLPVGIWFQAKVHRGPDGRLKRIADATEWQPPPRRSPEERREILKTLKSPPPVEDDMTIRYTNVRNLAEDLERHLGRDSDSTGYWLEVAQTIKEGLGLPYSEIPACIAHDLGYEIVEAGRIIGEVRRYTYHGKTQPAEIWTIALWDEVEEVMTLIAWDEGDGLQCGTWGSHAVSLVLHRNWPRTENYAGFLPDGTWSELDDE